jgi:hypothetical protein
MVAAVVMVVIKAHQFVFLIWRRTNPRSAVQKQRPLPELERCMPNDTMSNPREITMNHKHAMNHKYTSEQSDLGTGAAASRSRPARHQRYSDYLYYSNL